MNSFRSILLKKLKYSGIIFILLAFIFTFPAQDVYSQASFTKKNKRYGAVSKPKNEYKKNIVWVEGLGSNQVAGIKYERIFMFGAWISMRVDLGITPFVVDEKYNFIAGRSITPITGLGFYLHVQPFPIRVGLGCSVLHDIFWNGIPEVGFTNSTTYGERTYRARAMPYLVVEGTIKDRWTIRGGYCPIFDPPNELQTDLYLTHFGMVGVGYKFGR